VKGLRLKRPTWLWLIILVASIGWLVISGDLPARVAWLYPNSVPAHPYLRLDHGLLLYLGMPLSVMAAIFLYLSPGLTALLATGRHTTVAPWLLEGFGLSFLIHMLASSTLKIIAPLPVGRPEVLTTAAVVAGASWLLWAWRSPQVGEVQWPFETAEGRRRLWGLLTFCFMAMVALLPVLFWQDLTEDGLEALEIGRSLTWWIVPRFLNDSGLMGLGIGMLPMAFPSHWFGMLFGWIEASARLPLVLYLVPVVAGVFSLIEWRSERSLRPVQEALVVGAIACVVFVLAYNASYDDYLADVASPAAFALLTVSAMIGMAYGLWSSRWWTFLGFAILSFGARPTGLLFAMILGCCSVLALPDERRRMILWTAASVAAFVVFHFVYERLFVPWASFGDLAGYGTGTILDRFQYLRVFEVERLVWIIVPAGILPALTPPSRNDRYGIVLTMTIVAYIAVFFFPAFANLHHFVPAMLLPIVVFWRRSLILGPAKWRDPLVFLGLLVALVASRPRSFELNRTMREIGATASYQIGGYGPTRDTYREAIAGADLTFSLFAKEWDVADPGRELVGGTQLWYYAARDQPVNRDTQYLFVPGKASAPDGFDLHFIGEGGAVYLRDSTTWGTQRTAPRRTDFRSALYDIPRETRFYFIGIPAGAYDIDLVDVPLLGRLFWD